MFALRSTPGALGYVKRSAPTLAVLTTALVGACADLPTEADRRPDPGMRTLGLNPPAPTLTSIGPTSGVQGNTVSVTLTGTNFVSGATVAVSGSNVTVSNVTVVSATSITADFVIASTAAAGARNVTVTTSGGTSGAQTFTINASADPQEVPVQPSRLPLTPR